MLGSDEMVERCNVAHSVDGTQLVVQPRYESARVIKPARAAIALIDVELEITPPSPLSGTCTSAFASHCRANAATSSGPSIFTTSKCSSRTVTPSPAPGPAQAPSAAKARKTVRRSALFMPVCDAQQPLEAALDQPCRYRVSARAATSCSVPASSKGPRRWGRAGGHRENDRREVVDEAPDHERRHERTWPTEKQDSRSDEALAELTAKHR